MVTIYESILGYNQSTDNGKLHHLQNTLKIFTTHDFYTFMKFHTNTLRFYYIISQNLCLLDQTLQHSSRIGHGTVYLNK